MNRTTHFLRRARLRRRWWLPGLAAILCLTACGSNALTRIRAADAIRSSEGFQKPVLITLQPEYRQSLTLIGTGSRTTPKEEFALRRFLESHADLAVFDHLGLVDFKVSKIEYPDSASSPVTVTATLTGEGRSASRDWQQSDDGWTIPLARRELVEVTELAGGEGDSKTAHAEYAWHWQPTEFGKNFDSSRREHQTMPETIRQNLSGASMTDVMRQASRVIVFDGSKPQTASASFQLYDDGWRLEKLGI